MVAHHDEWLGQWMKVMAQRDLDVDVFTLLKDRLIEGIPQQALAQHEWRDGCKELWLGQQGAQHVAPVAKNIGRARFESRD
jgi:hypothetical protein